MRIYIYIGDRHSCDGVKGQLCTAVLNEKGKCIRGKNGNMLVEFNGHKVVVLARLLRKQQPHHFGELLFT